MSFSFCKQRAKHLSSVPQTMARYRTNAEFAFMCKCIVAAAFVPLNQISEALATSERNLLEDLTFLLD